MERLIKYELCKIISYKVLWIFFIIGVLCIIFFTFSDYLHVVYLGIGGQGISRNLNIYFTIQETLVLIACLILSIIGSSRIFTVEKETGVQELILTSKNGRHADTASKFIAVGIYTFSINLVLQLTLYVSMLLANRPINHVVKLNTIAGYESIKLVINTFQYKVFCIFVILIGSLVVSLLTAMISAYSQKSLTPFVIMTILYTVEAALFKSTPFGGGVMHIISSYIYNFNLFRLMYARSYLIKRTDVPFDNLITHVYAIPAFFIFIAAIGMIITYYTISKARANRDKVENV